MYQTFLATSYCFLETKSIEYSRGTPKLSVDATATVNKHEEADDVRNLKVSKTT